VAGDIREKFLRYFIERKEVGGRGRDRTGGPLLAKRTTRLQRLVAFSLTTNVHNKSGNVLFVQRQPECVEKDRSAHSCDTALYRAEGPCFFSMYLALLPP
jgi:hypothetical protein